MSDDEDFFASFRPVPPGPAEHFWRLDGVRARCDRCGMVLIARVRQLQPGHTPLAELIVERSGTLYRAQRCLWGRP